MPFTVADIGTTALRNLGVLGRGSSMTPEDGQVIVEQINLLLDNLNTERCGVFAEAFATGTLVPNLAPHTIGPTGTFVVTQRPVSLDGCNLVMNTVSPAIQAPPIVVRDAQWWLNQSVKSLTSTFPTDVYYSADWPNGKLFFWPVPTIAYQVEFMFRVVLANVILTTITDAMPPGYRDMVTLTLTEMLAPIFQQPLPAGIAKRAQEARARVYANNDVTPLASTQDAGMPSGASSGVRTDFNYRTGQVVGR